MKSVCERESERDVGQNAKQCTQQISSPFTFFQLFTPLSDLHTLLLTPLSVEASEVRMGSCGTETHLQSSQYMRRDGDIVKEREG